MISRCCSDTTCRKIRSPVRRAHQVFRSLKLGTHDLTPGWDQTMERHHSNTIARTPVSRELPSNRDESMCAETSPADALSAAPRNCGPSTDDRSGGNLPAGALAEPGACHCHDPFRDQLQAVRRRLWILRDARSLAREDRTGVPPVRCMGRRRWTRTPRAPPRLRRRREVSNQGRSGFWPLDCQAEACQAAITGGDGRAPCGRRDQPRREVIKCRPRGRAGSRARPRQGR